MNSGDGLEMPCGGFTWVEGIFAPFLRKVFGGLGLGLDFDFFKSQFCRRGWAFGDILCQVAGFREKPGFAYLGGPGLHSKSSIQGLKAIASLTLRKTPPSSDEEDLCKAVEPHS